MIEITTIITVITLIFSIGILLLSFLVKGGGEGAFVGMLGGVCFIGIFISGILGSLISIALATMNKNKYGYLFLIINVLPQIALFLKIWW